MEKNPFQITATKKGELAQINIIGIIAFEDDSIAFKNEIESLVKQGCTKAQLYINSIGGSVFDANDIINILEDNFTEINGDGGAIVASAAAFIAIKCKTFTMPENGLFMIHPVRGRASGTSIQIESYLNLMNNMNAIYKTAFKDKATNKTEFESKWESGADYWLNAKDAKAAGFITGIRAKIKADKGTSEMLSACADSDIKERMSEFLINNNTEMEQLAKLLNLSAKATEQELVAAVEPLVNEVVTLKADLQTAQDEKTAIETAKQELQDKLDAIELKEKETKTNEAKGLIATAIKDGRLDDDENHTAEAFYLRNFETDFEGTKTMLEKLPKRVDLKDRFSATDEGGNVWEKRQKEIEAANRRK
jgi:ATP-dependent Clp protease, protease subunit